MLSGREGILGLLIDRRGHFSPSTSDWGQTIMTPSSTTSRTLATGFSYFVLLAATAAAQAQTGYYAAIAYSQSTGKIGYTARQARTKALADQLALRMCGAADARVFMWGVDQWVAIATVEEVKGTAGFGRGYTPDEAQQKALVECGKRAHGHAYRVALCFHSSGRRVTELRRVAATLEQAKSKTGYFAAIAYSPSTGKIGSTAGDAKTIEAAKAIAVRRCKEPDAKAFMWGDQWIAVAVAEGAKGTAGFGPGATREEAEKAALEQCRKYAKGRPCRVALCLYSTGEEEPAVEQAAAQQSTQAVSDVAPAEDSTQRGQTRRVRPANDQTRP
jgi:hypothetical protein